MVWNVPPPPLGHPDARILRAPPPARDRPGRADPAGTSRIMTSLRNDSRPAIHRTAVARGLIAPVKTPRPLTMWGRPAEPGAVLSGRRRPRSRRPGPPGRSGSYWDERNQRRVRVQGERIADDIVAAREVQHAMAVDGHLQRLRVVGLAVTLHAERPHVDPVYIAGSTDSADAAAQAPPPAVRRRRAARCGPCCRSLVRTAHG